MYLPEQIRQKVIDRINAASTAHAQFYRAPASKYDSYPVYILEYAENDKLWSGTSADKLEYFFNLYLGYAYKNEETDRELAEVALSNAVGELYEDVFNAPDCLAIPSGWVQTSQASWGYGGDSEVPLRMVKVQIKVTVHNNR